MRRNGAPVNSGLAVVAFGLAVAALVVRFRRSRGVERLQLKWFTYAATLASVGLVSSIFVPARCTRRTYRCGCASAPADEATAFVRRFRGHAARETESDPS